MKNYDHFCFFQLKIRNFQKKSPFTSLKVDALQKIFHKRWEGNIELDSTDDICKIFISTYISLNNL